MRYMIRKHFDRKTIFHYFKDRYAVKLLSYIVYGGMKVSEIRRSAFGRLLQKPIARELLSRTRGNLLCETDCKSLWPAQTEAYVLTLGRWGCDDWSRGYHQMARAGRNLVLQVNFNKNHDRQYARMLGVHRSVAHKEDLFNGSQHPVNDNGRLTLAWVRLDIDFHTREALIEEVQSDWIDYATWEFKFLDNDDIWAREARSTKIGGRDVRVRAYYDYYRKAVRPHVKIWDGCALCAAIWFLREKLDIRRIYYHTPETNMHLKQLKNPDAMPPRSIYVDLPRKFCFERTTRAPLFLQATKKDRYLQHQIGRAELPWYVLEL